MKKRTQYSICLLLCLIFSIVPTDSGFAGDNIWSTNGPLGVKIKALAIDPEDSNTIYAASDLMVYRSTDAGENWITLSKDIAGTVEIREFAFDPQNTSTIYMADLGGIQKSIDGGQTWEQKSMVIINGEDYRIRGYAIDTSPIDGTIYVGAYGEFPNGHGGIFRSKDGAETWEQVATTDMTDAVITAVKVAPSAPHIIYAGGYTSGGVFKSVDGGDTWQNINGNFGAPPTIRTLCVDPHDSQVVYLGTTRDGLYKTINGGDSWTPIGTGLGTSDIAEIIMDPSNQQLLYVGGGPNMGTGIPGVYQSYDNNGTTWHAMMDGMGSRIIYELAIDQNDPQNLYAGTSSGVWKFTFISSQPDYSMSINDGELFTNQTDVTLHMTAPAGTTQMMISNDGGFNGANWEPFAAQKSWTITSYGETILPRTVYAKFITNGQISGQYQDDIILDTVSPTGSVTIDSTRSENTPDPTFETANPLSTNLVQEDELLFLPSILTTPPKTILTLSLSATDDLSGVGEMMISTENQFTNAVWENFQTEKDWTVWEGVTTTIYVKFRDRAGNVSEVFSDTYNP